MLFPIVFYTLALLALTALTLWCHHGRRIDEHPHCRKCNFDLTGKPPESTRCSECGADLIKPNSIRIGRRQRRPLLFALGLLLLVFLLATGGSAIYLQSRFSHYLSRLPTPVLNFVALHSDDAHLLETLNEVSVRVMRKRVTSDDLQPLVAGLLDRQADRSQSWNTKLGDFIQFLAENGVISQDNWLRYGRGAIGFGFTPRAFVRQGDEIPVEVTISCRGGYSRFLDADGSVPFNITLSDITLLRKEGNWPLPSQSLTGLYSRGATSALLLLPSELSASLPPGKHAIRVGAELRTASSHSAYLDAAEKHRIDIPLTLTVLPATQSTVTLVNDEPALTAARHACSKFQLVSNCNGGRLRGDDTLRCLAPAGPELPLALEVDVRDGDTLLRKYEVWCSGTESSCVSITSREPPLPPTVSLYFRPSARVAAEHPRIMRIPNLTFERHNVTVLGLFALRPATDADRGYTPPSAGASTQPVP